MPETSMMSSLTFRQVGNDIHKKVSLLIAHHLLWSVMLKQGIHKHATMKVYDSSIIAQMIHANQDRNITRGGDGIDMKRTTSH